MTQLDEAIGRYHRILESEPHKDMAWAEALRQRMQAQHLTVGGRPVSPFLRPHFITRRQYSHLVKAAEALFTAIDRVKRLALSTPTLLTRMELLPAEKMLAAIDPGYSFLAVTSLLDTHIHNGTMQFVQYNAETPVGVAYGEALADLFYDCPPVKEFRRRYPLARVGGARHLLQALLKAYKEYGGKRHPSIAILEFRQPFQTTESGEYQLLADLFRREGYPTEVISPDQLEYRNGVLRRGDFAIDLVYRRVKVQEFLVRFDLTHPLVRAYRERTVCVVNSFRSELAQKKAIFDLLTDEEITAKFPASERKAVREYIPWTRVVTAGRTTYHGRKVDLLEFILKNRQKLVLKPNDAAAEQHAVTGSETDEAGWDRALRMASRNRYVVQEKVEPTSAVFPLLQYGGLEMREMNVEVHPHSYLGKVQGCSTWLTGVGPGGFSTVAGLAPTFILESR